MKLGKAEAKIFGPGFKALEKNISYCYDNGRICGISEVIYSFPNDNEIVFTINPKNGSVYLGLSNYSYTLSANDLLMLKELADEIRYEAAEFKDECNRLREENKDATINNETMGD